MKRFKKGDIIYALSHDKIRMYVITDIEFSREDYCYYTTEDVITGYYRHISHDKAFGSVAEGLVKQYNDKLNDILPQFDAIKDVKVYGFINNLKFKIRLMKMKYLINRYNQIIKKCHDKNPELFI